MSVAGGVAWNMPSHPRKTPVECFRIAKSLYSDVRKAA